MPDQIDKLDQEADALHRHLYPEQYSDTPPAVKTADTPNPDVPPVVPAPPVPPIDQPPLETPPVLETPPATPPVTPADEPPVPPVQAVDDPTGLKREVEVLTQKYRVLQGKYDAEVPRMKQENDRLQGLLMESIATINRFQANPPVATKTTDVEQPAHQTPGEFKLDDIKGVAEIKEDYPDIYGVLDGIFTKINAYTSSVAKTVQDVRAETQVDRGDKFVTALHGLCPTWETIRDEPGFATWLEGVEPFSGVKLINLAREAQNNMDATRLASFYNKYKAFKEGVTPPTPPPPGDTGDPKVLNIAPPRGGTSPTPPVELGATNQLITQSFIEKFYNDAVRGLYAGRDKEYADTEERINRAVREKKVSRG